MSPDQKTTPQDVGPVELGQPTFASEFFRRRSVLIVAGILAAAWILGLVALALYSANPVTINQKQIRESDTLVTATRDDAKSSTLTVTKEWFRGEDLKTITVTNLNETNIATGQPFLVPLQKLGKGRFQVTPTTLPNEAPLVYPATPEAEDQIQTLLESRAK